MSAQKGSQAHLDRDLDSSDLLRIATSDARFSRALIKDPERFAGAFSLSKDEVDMLRTIPKTVDLGTQFAYDG